MADRPKENLYDQLSEEQKNAPMPYCRHEIAMARSELDKRRWAVACLIVFILFVATNAFWVIREMNQSEEVWTYEIQQDSGEGGNNTYSDNIVRFIGGDYDGEAED